MEKFTSEHSCARYVTPSAPWWPLCDDNDVHCADGGVSRYLMSGRDIVHLFNGMKAQCKQFEEMNAKLQAKGSS